MPKTTITTVAETQQLPVQDFVAAAAGRSRFEQCEAPLKREPSEPQGTRIRFGGLRSQVASTSEGKEEAGSLAETCNRSVAA